MTKIKICQKAKGGKMISKELCKNDWKDEFLFKFKQAMIRKPILAMIELCDGLEFNKVIHTEVLNLDNKNELQESLFKKLSEFESIIENFLQKKVCFHLSSFIDSTKRDKMLLAKINQIVSITFIVIDKID